MYTKHKITTLFLALMITVSALGSCSAEDTEESPATDTTATTAEESMETEISDHLPEVQYDGYEFRMFLREGSNGSRGASMYAEEMTGDLLNDIVYNRNLAIEDRFNISFRCIYSEDNGFGADCVPTLIANQAHKAKQKTADRTEGS